MNIRTEESVDSRTTASRAHLQEVLFQAQQLVLFRGILADPILVNLVELLDFVSREPKSGRRERERISRSYAHFFSRLASKAESAGPPAAGTPWQNHLLDLVLSDENVFSSKAQHFGLEAFGKSLLRQVELDLQRLRGLYHLDADQLLAAMQQAGLDTVWLKEAATLSAGSKAAAHPPLRHIKAQFHASEHWDLLLPVLADWYRRAGCGIFGRYRAFHWKRAADRGLIEPIPEPDPIRLEELIGCDNQKAWLIRNTSHFLAGYPANNIFVYGDRGTGKSSAIKALLNHFANEPLRMIEVSRDHLADLPQVLNQLRRRPEYFIIFVDDLSFEEGETQYKTLKAVLEGSLEARPRNVLIYASSNRRHLIKEYFSDRNGFESEEVRHQDTLQEKVSLADRFGIQLVFVAPSQNEYLAIVRSMARQRKLNILDDELERQALQWVQLHNARSGRTARQFIDYLAAETAEEKHGLFEP